MNQSVLSKEEINKVYEAAANERDRFFIKVLLETGLKIGEVLSVKTEAILLDHNNGHRIQVVHPKSGLIKEAFVSQELMDVFDDYGYYILDELDDIPEFAFIKIKGRCKGNPMTYQDAYAVLKKISDETGLNVNANTLRRTYIARYSHLQKSKKDLKKTC